MLKLSKLHPTSSQLTSKSAAVTPPHGDESLPMAIAIAAAADERKAEEITILHVAEVTPLADYFVIVTGFSKAQVRAIARAIEDKVQQEFQRLPIRSEGLAEGTWVVQDYGIVIAHVFLPQEREFYNLEAFWGHAQQIEFQPTTH